MEKTEILAALKSEREKFMDTIDGLSAEAMREPGVVGKWSVKDIVSHISQWEAEMVRLLFEASQGQKPTTIHFSEKETDIVNSEWQQEAASRPLERVMADFQAVRKQTIRRVEGLSQQDLSDPNRYPWLRGQPLENWIAGDSFDHEAEHAAQIREWRSKRSNESSEKPEE